MDLTGKKVLLIAPNFYNYEEEIIRSLEKFGADVTFYEEVINRRPYTLLRNKTMPPFKYLLDNTYFTNILKHIKDDEYDIFFLIRGELIDRVFLQKMREKLKSALFIMYQWDSVVHNDYVSKIKYFNRVLTFDKLDSQQYAIDYLPLFYTDGYAKIATKQDDIQYDIVFYGTYHSDRLEIIKSIIQECDNKHLRFKHHLYASRMEQMKLLLSGKIRYADLGLLKSFKVTSDDIVKVYSKTVAVLDIEMTDQTGLTIRTLEALGANRKLLTTNLQIKRSALYDEKYISILDRNNIKLDKNFFELNPYNNKYKKFHIDSWLTNIIEPVLHKDTCE